MLGLSRYCWKKTVKVSKHTLFLFTVSEMGRTGGVAVRALASHQCDLSLRPELLCVVCGDG